MFKISKENKKLIFGIILAALVFLSYQVIASYMTNPVDTTLKYPNPGHYPGEIGPGTFNASNSANPYWSFPDSSGNRFTGLEIRNGSGQFYKTLQVFNNFYTYANTYLGNDSSDKTIVKGNLEVSGKGNFYELCIQGNCTTVWPIGAGGGAGGFSDCEIVEKECCKNESQEDPYLRLSCNVSCPSDKWLVSGGGKCGTFSFVEYAGGGAKTIEGVGGIYESYPKIAGKGGSWYIYGYTYKKVVFVGYPEGWQHLRCVKVYALCCNFTKGGSGAVEDIWVNETGDTMTGDLNVTGGIVVGNPAEGNKGPGTINAEKIYVNGSEVGGGGRKIETYDIIDNKWVELGDFDHIEICGYNYYGDYYTTLCLYDTLGNYYSLKYTKAAGWEGLLLYKNNNLFGSYICNDCTIDGIYLYGYVGDSYNTPSEFCQYCKNMKVVSYTQPSRGSAKTVCNQINSSCECAVSHCCNYYWGPSILCSRYQKLRIK